MGRSRVEEEKGEGERRRGGERREIKEEGRGERGREGEGGEVDTLERCCIVCDVGMMEECS